MAGPDNDRSLLPEVCWQEGMLLMPQHFQLQSRQLLQYSYALAAMQWPDLWGIIDLGFNRDALAAGVLELERFTALFPDGTRVRIDDNAVVASRYLADAIEHPADVFVALLRPAAEQVPEMFSADEDFVGRAAPGRYLHHTLALNDTFNQQQQADVAVVRYQLKLVLEGENEALADHDLIRIGRLQRRGESLHLDDNDIPPALNLSVVPALQAYVRNLLSWLERRRGQLLADVDGLPESQRFALYSLLCRCLGHWSCWLDQPFVTPGHVYRYVLAAAREVSYLGGSRAGPPRLHENAEIIPYRHRDITASLAGVAEYLRKGIDELLGAMQQELLFSREGQFFHLGLDRGQVRRLSETDSLRLRLTARRGLSLAPAAVSSRCKLAAPATLTHLLARSLPGIGLEPLSPGADGELLLDICRDGRYWEEIQAGGDLALYMEEAPESLQVCLQLDPGS